MKDIVTVFSPDARIRIKRKIAWMRTEVAHENEQRRYHILILVPTEDCLDFFHSLL